MKQQPSENRTLLGFLANEATRLPCLLHGHRQEVWLRQGEGIVGRGVGRYMDGDAVLRIQPGPVQGDLHLGDLSDDEGTTHLVAHVSVSTDRALTVEEIQPFRVGRWLFACDGALDLGDRGKALLDSLPPFLQNNRKSQLDGELLFLHFIALLHRQHMIDRPTAPVFLALCLHDMMQTIEAPMRLLATNGQVMLAYRIGLPLGYHRIIGIDGCQLCGVGEETRRLEALVESHRRFRGICVADQPFASFGSWDEIPERQVLVVHPSLEVELVPGTE